MVLRFVFIGTLIFTCWAQSEPLIVTSGDMGSYTIEIDAAVDGQWRRFQLDTGANSTIVTADEQTFSYPSTEKAMHRGAAGVAVECEVIRPDELRVASLQVVRPAISRCDHGFTGFNNMGLEVIAGQIVELNFQHSIMQFHVTSPEDQNWRALKRHANGHLGILVQAGGVERGAIFDTGAQLSAVDKEFVLAHPEMFTPLPSQTPVSNITGKPVAADFYELNEIAIEGLKVKKLVVIAFDFGPDLRQYFGSDTPFILGTNVIVKANWILDLKANRWAVTTF